MLYQQDDFLNRYGHFFKIMFWTLESIQIGIAQTSSSIVFSQPILNLIHIDINHKNYYSLFILSSVYYLKI